MTLKELQKKAAELKIAGRSKMNKAQLEAAVGFNRFAAHATDVVAPTNKTTDEDVSLLLSVMSKGDARRFRKELYAQGRRREAGLPAKAA